MIQGEAKSLRREVKIKGGMAVITLDDHGSAYICLRPELETVKASVAKTEPLSAAGFPMVNLDFDWEGNLMGIEII